MTAPLEIITQAIREARMANGLLAAGWLSEHEVDIVARAVLAALAAEGLAPPVWQPIEMAPKDGTAVLIYRSRLSWLDQDGKPCLDPLRDHVERFGLGWYEDGGWHDQGTAHDLFESWIERDHLPTHWMPLPAAPQPPVEPGEGE